MALTQLLSDLRRDAAFMQNVVAWRTLPAAPADLLPVPGFLHPALHRSLHHRNIDSLYTHQADSINLTHEGNHVVVVTPTASGKTLCYHLPVLHSLLEDPAARALYLYPTKALAQDQLSAMRGWSSDLTEETGAPLPVAIYDGDTPSADRSRIRSHARLLLSNPDMLHVGILPAHPHWADFFANLRVIVLDELHTYRGVFGSHVANVIRRLQRICAYYGSSPQFICTSATISNPAELAQCLIERPVSLVTRNGAPRGEKHVILYNPPLYDAEHGLRRSAVLEAQEIALRCLNADVQSILFARSRLTTELLLTYVRDGIRSAPGLGRLDPALAARGYRGGYLADERRSIEAGLRAGEVRVVTATNALELGLDIGQLQTALLCGYPGSIASFWQQVGRAGRTREASLAIYVATGQPIDQYLVRNSQYLFDHSPESALVNPDNPMLLLDHLRCAVAEIPFAAHEALGKSPNTTDMLTLLAEQGEVQHTPSRDLWAGIGNPARSVSLRSAGGDPVVIQVERSGTQDVSSTTVIGEIDQASALSIVHDGAVYIHEGTTFLVTRLDLENHIATVGPADVDFYTAVDRDIQVEFLHTAAERANQAAVACHGDLRVSTQVLSYRRIKRHSHDLLGSFPLEYPPSTLETTGYWFTVTAQAQQALAEAGEWFDSVNDYGPNWQQSRDQVRKRDRYRCSHCGRPEADGRQHDVHHLVPFRTFGFVQGVNRAYLDANRLENLILVCRSCHRRIESAVRTRGALDGLAYALHNLAPLYLMCDRQDLDSHITRAELTATDGGEATVVIFERTAAGLGFSERLFELHDTLLRAVRDNIQSCPCNNGCPACVGPVLEGHSQLETKRLTLALVNVLMSAD